ncbi:MAG: sulfotransferase [Acidimicrobiales bacterium]|nr:sulfotransferase [Hyphomonadaceae bacterium]RZV42238.1 MAG: sulfotransferase [Acidimicrobiales bacterium]
MALPNRGILVEQAVAETGLSDFGDPWFFGHIDVLIPALNNEAKLSEAGEFGARHMIVSSLVKRLRHIDLIKQNPEILDEEVNVTAVLSGLPRTGSTMLHRMLTAAPQLTGVRWYETQNYVPLEGESRDDPTPRLEAAKGVLAYMLDALPELMSIHPMSIEQPDEEVIILGQLFSSSMIESTYFVPSYAAWLWEQDASQAYADLIQILKSLQWQDPSRKAKSWVLKTPGHLMAMDVVLDAFPEAKIVMTHRDPVTTLPSYCSMEASLYKLGSDDISSKMIGEYWQERLKQWLGKFMAVRTEVGDERFIDIDYKELTTHASEQGARVLEFAGIPMSSEIKEGMSDWIEANRREHRAAHKYTLEDFGLDADDIRHTYSSYIDAFL